MVIGEFYTYNATDAEYRVLANKNIQWMSVQIWTEGGSAAPFCPLKASLQRVHWHTRFRFDSQHTELSVKLSLFNKSEMIIPFPALI